ncbi:HNH endonuclease [Frankia sp. Cpl3]|nr:HNH endonuclease [Frankia sp. Cpl3]
MPPTDPISTTHNPAGGAAGSEPTCGPSGRDPVGVAGGAPSGALGGKKDFAVDAEEAFVLRLRGALGTIAAAARMVAAGQARLLRAVAAVAEVAAPGELDPAGLFAFYAPEEIAGVLAVTGPQARSQLELAQAVVRRLPRAVAALESGVLDLPRLVSLENATRPLSDDLAAQGAARMLEEGPGRNRRSFAAGCAQAVIRVDPDGADERAEKRRADRTVRIIPGRDATSRLSALLAAGDAAACYQRVERLAEGIAHDRAQGDERTREQIRADVFVDLLMGRGEHAAPIGCEIQVVVPLPTLLGVGRDPGQLDGYGPLPAAVAREIAMRPESTWRRLLTDERGTLVEVAERRLPSPAQVRHVRARNRQCTHPACTRPATRTDTDHTAPYAQGGPTLTINLGPCCRRHHRMRHQPGRLWKVRQPSPGTFEWTGPSGTTTTTYPHDYLTGQEQRPPGR